MKMSAFLCVPPLEIEANPSVEVLTLEVEYLKRRLEEERKFSNQVLDELKKVRKEVQQQSKGTPTLKVQQSKGIPTLKVQQQSKGTPTLKVQQSKETSATPNDDLANRISYLSFKGLGKEFPSNTLGDG